MSKYYTGVGSRDISEDTYQLLVEIGEKMAEKGYILRSGHADGADAAFEQGACSVDPEMTEIWVPWKTFNKQLPTKPKLHVLEDWRISDAQQFLVDTDIMPWFPNCKQSVQKLHARNVHQVIGITSPIVNPHNLLSKVCIYAAEENDKGEVKGGTRSAVLVSRHFGVPTYNVMIDEQRDKLLRLLEMDS